MIFTFFYYYIFASSVLIYGVGLNKLVILASSFGKLRLHFIKATLVILISVLTTWGVSYEFLVPLNLTELYPLCAVMVFLTVSIFFETMIRITTDDVTSDYSFSLLVIILSLGESLNIVDVMLISVATILSFLTLLPVTYIIKQKLPSEQTKLEFGNKKALLLVVLAMIIIILSSGNVSWLCVGGWK